MKVSFATLSEDVEAVARSVLSRSTLGIDIGTSSIKVVQLSVDAHGPVLDTYGVIELGPYADLVRGEVTTIDASKRAGALLDLLHEVDASARRGGMSLPLSSTFISVIESPKRDAEQMRRLIPSEAKPYIPVPMDSVTLDWQIIPEGGAGRAFEHAEAKEAVSPQMQKVLLAAVRNETIDLYRATAQSADLSVSFYEVEMFSASRAIARRAGECALLIDLGASASKMYIVDEHGTALAAHATGSGGAAITTRIMSACDWQFAEAESAKRSEGLSNARQRAGRAIAEEVASIWTEAKRMIQEYDRGHGRSITHVVLVGGGARMPGIADHAGKHFDHDILLGLPFEHVQGPMILADVLHDVGPLYAVATGLALRAISR